MGYIAIDLGTTNIRVTSYDDGLKPKQWRSKPVHYIREDARVEFDAVAYMETILELLAEIVEVDQDSRELKKIILTGQAESLVVLGKDLTPLMNAISWMDERSTEECSYMGKILSMEEYHNKTGQLSILPTWPATKILWLKRHLPKIHAKAAHYVLLKDYIAFCLTGKLYADCSIATFSFYFDIYKRQYWEEMMDICGIRSHQLPDLVEPNTEIGKISPEIASATGLSNEVRVNAGCLDQFTAMIGTGTMTEGAVSISMGTVFALATMAPAPLPQNYRIATHYGLGPGNYIYLLVIESGGSCFDWYMNNFLPGSSHDDLKKRLATKDLPGDLIFLPHIVGTNPPDFNPKATGMFYGLRSQHDAADLYYAVLEGSGHLIKKNIDELVSVGLRPDRVAATGGGARDNFFCQLCSDLTGVPFDIPTDTEVTSLGAAIVGAVNDGMFRDFNEAARKVVSTARHFNPNPTGALIKKHKRFNLLYDCSIKVTQI
ncbi:MAG: hypothetical protein GX352_00980 [Clostridiales bacterium]|nr:hypothetical protein [Clostridiales bacterium]